MDCDDWCTSLSLDVEKKPWKSIKIMASCLTSTHYDCTVDPLGHAGHWSEEEECFKKHAQLSKPFQFVHPCLVLMEFTYCNVKLAECAAVHWLPVSTVKSWPLHIYMVSSLQLQGHKSPSSRSRAFVYYSLIATRPPSSYQRLLAEKLEQMDGNQFHHFQC
jgi:hypothetical protein